MKTEITKTSIATFISICLSLIIILFKNELIYLIQDTNFPENKSNILHYSFIFVSLGFLVAGIVLICNLFIKTAQKWIKYGPGDLREGYIYDGGKENREFIPLALFQKYYIEIGILVFAALLFFVTVFMPLNGQIYNNNYPNYIKVTQDSLNVHITGLSGLEKSIEELTIITRNNNQAAIMQPYEVEKKKNTLFYIIRLFVGAVILIALVLLIISNNKIAKSVAGLLSIAGTLTLSTNILPIDNLSLTYSPSIETSKNDNSGLDYKINEIVLYPFNTGSTDLSKKTEYDLNSFLKKMLLRKNKITKIYISGRFDKRVLNDSLTKIYGSNIGLAQARVNTVEEIIRKHHFLDSVTTIPFINGPDNYKLFQTEKQLEKDRSVSIIVEYLEQVIPIKN